MATFLTADQVNELVRALSEASLMTKEDRELLLADIEGGWVQDLREFSSPAKQIQMDLTKLNTTTWPIGNDFPLRTWLKAGANQLKLKGMPQAEVFQRMLDTVTWKEQREPPVIPPVTPPVPPVTPPRKLMPVLTVVLVGALLFSVFVVITLALTKSGPFSPPTTPVSGITPIITALPAVSNTSHLVGDVAAIVSCPPVVGPGTPAPPRENLPATAGPEMVRYVLEADLFNLVLGTKRDQKGPILCDVWSAAGASTIPDVALQEMAKTLAATIYTEYAVTQPVTYTLNVPPDLQNITFAPDNGRVMWLKWQVDRRGQKFASDMVERASISTTNPFTISTGMPGHETDTVTVRPGETPVPDGILQPFGWVRVAVGEFTGNREARAKLTQYLNHQGSYDIRTASDDWTKELETRLATFLSNELTETKVEAQVEFRDIQDASFLIEIQYYPAS